LILTFTDFGTAGPYRGQVNSVLTTLAPGCPIVELMCDAPRFAPRASAYLLAALVDHIPAGSVVVAVVDPGVGSQRDPLVVDADGIWYVGPDNGLLELVCGRASAARVWRIDWRPKKLSNSFHGRDLFAPVAARLCVQADVIAKMGTEIGYVSRNWPLDLWEVIYVDDYGNCVSGISAAGLPKGESLGVGDGSVAFAPTFSAVSPRTVFWYENSLSLVEIAVNCGNAAEQLGLKIGSPIRKCTTLAGLS
jgi:hypothetical protein